MAATAPQSTPVGPDTPIIVKVAFDGDNRRFKLPLRELGAQVFPSKLRQLLSVAPGVDVTFERYSDSAGSYIRLDSENPGVYKQLYRAAKAKLRLRIKATTKPAEEPVSNESTSTPAVEKKSQEDKINELKYNYLDTVLRRSPLPEEDPFVVGTKSTRAPAPLPDMFPLRDSGMFGDKLFGCPSVDVPPPNSQTLSPAYRVFTLGQDNLSHPTIVASQPGAGQQFCIDCNNCDQSIPNEHYHCSICDGGDYDLCQTCVNNGALCRGEGHWLIKRFVQNGIVTNSTTERIAPRKETEAKETTEKDEKAEEKEMPAPTPQEDQKVEPKQPEFKRTCNACFLELDESKLVTCKNCPDYDLCITCVVRDDHGHHPGHEFGLIQERQFSLRNMVMGYCRPGRRHKHAAICDGCDKTVVGVRHKCLNCPDWDYCVECVKDAPKNHPGHRFAPIYEPIAEVSQRREIHFGIFCDGPLCKSNPKYISGERYKCAVCHDTDFCANCEAIPSNSHNRTHPLIKFKTPVRHVSVSTFGEKGTGERMAAMGDQPTTKSASTETVPSANSTNAATQVQREAVEDPTSKLESEKFAKSLRDEEFAKSMKTVAETQKLQAHFVRDTIPDGSRLSPNKIVSQTWTLYNPGPLTWPVGSCVHFVGGDAMLNVDFDHPSEVEDIHNASRSDKLASAVPPFSSADFTVTLKTPRRTGKTISYWRLKSPEGVPFGHKLWCDIDVQEEEIPATSDVKMSSDEPEPAKEEEKSDLKGSAMIFPKLEKESPVSSTHEATDSPAHASDQAMDDEQSILEDVETLTLDDETDEGFLTDEEYDILDASDQEPTSV
ncbi:hypothetical protein FQN54_004295 [Arachnomyces sp. PD_36]|nr:hypothetical protein FQN54_004295 [Arachnomyces sp. PD_36]